jgi:hypothetical protein
VTVFVQPLAPGKFESSIWKDIAEDTAIVDKELIEKMFKMNPGAKRAEVMQKKCVAICAAFCFSLR